MFIQDSRRSYRTYSDTEVLVSTTELILILRSIYWSYRTWTCISDLIHVLQSIYLSYGSYTGLTKLILVLRILYCNSDTEVLVSTTEYFTGTRVPVGTTEQIPYTEVLIQIRDLSKAGVPVGTTGLIQRQAYP